VLDPAGDDPVAALKELTRGQGVDLALDCSGAEPARAAAIRATRTWGTVCFVGEGGSVNIDVSRDMIRKQLTVIGSWTFSSVIQGECAGFVADRGIDVERVFTERYTLDQAADAYRLFDTQSTGKGVFLL
jgi:threonine dehydrogenase-like Zn-dependent dehydrogenase